MVVYQLQPVLVQYLLGLSSKSGAVLIQPWLTPVCMLYSMQAKSSNVTGSEVSSLISQLNTESLPNITHVASSAAKDAYGVTF